MKMYVHPASPNCFMVLLIARHLGIEIETEFVDLTAGAQRHPNYLSLNPNGAVPTLVDGDLLLWESNAIAQHLASRDPAGGLWPEDDRLRVDIARWQFWAVAHWGPALRPYLWENVFKPMSGLGEPDLIVLEAAHGTFARYAAVLDGYLAARSYLVGDRLTIADFAVAPFLMYAEPAEIPLGPYPHVVDWSLRLCNLPAWKALGPTESNKL